MGSATLRLESHGMLDAIYLPILIMHGEGYHPLKRVEGEENCITPGPAIAPWGCYEGLEENSTGAGFGFPPPFCRLSRHRNRRVN